MLPPASADLPTGISLIITPLDDQMNRVLFLFPLRFRFAFALPPSAAPHTRTHMHTHTHTWKACFSTSRFPCRAAVLLVQLHIVPWLLLALLHLDMQVIYRI